MSDIRVVMVFKTSKGIFDSFKMASKEENRNKMNNALEPVLEVEALRVMGRFFELNPIDVTPTPFTF